MWQTQEEAGGVEVTGAGGTPPGRLQGVCKVSAKTSQLFLVVVPPLGPYFNNFRD